MYKIELNFSFLRKLFSAYVLKIRFICVQNVMHVILATFQQLNFCYLLRFIIISSVHGASLTCMRRTFELKKFCYESLKKVSILDLSKS